MQFTFTAEQGGEEKKCTSMPHFSKVRMTPLHSYKRPTIAPVFAKQKKSGEDLHFYERRHPGILTDTQSNSVVARGEGVERWAKEKNGI